MIEELIERAFCEGYECFQKEFRRNPESRERYKKVKHAKEKMVGEMQYTTDCYQQGIDPEEQSDRFYVQYGKMSPLKKYKHMKSAELGRTIEEIDEANGIPYRGKKDDTYYTWLGRKRAPEELEDLYKRKYGSFDQNETKIDPFNTNEERYAALADKISKFKDHFKYYGTLDKPDHQKALKKIRKS